MDSPLLSSDWSTKSKIIIFHPSIGIQSYKESDDTSLPPKALEPSLQRGGSRYVLFVNALALFFAESTRGLVLGSLFSYLRIAAFENGNGDATGLLGAAVAAFSGGRLISSFVFGHVSENGFPYSMLLQLTFLSTLIGQITYLAADAMPRGGLAAAIIVASRAIIGFGSGILPTARAVVVECSPIESRMRENARLGLFKYVGYAITPGLGAVLNFNITISGNFHINEFTAPAWIGLMMCILGIILVRFNFDPDFRSYKKKTKKSTHTNDTSTQSQFLSLFSLEFWMSKHGSLDDETTPMVFWAFLLFVALNLVTKGALASAEASLAPQYQQAVESGGNEVNPSTIVDDTSTFELKLGLVGLVSYLLMALKPLRIKKTSQQLYESSLRIGGSTGGSSVSLNTLDDGESDDDDSNCNKKNVLIELTPLNDEKHNQEAMSLSLSQSFKNFSETVKDSFSGVYLWIAAQADELDFFLLILSLLLTLAGGILVTPLTSNGGHSLVEHPLGLQQLNAGMSMLWALGAPICDVLAVSMFSVIVSSVRPGFSQASYMGYVSAAGSVGRIFYPATVGVIGLAGNMLFVVITSAICIVWSFSYYIQYRCSVPGAGWARRLLG
jgi:MFS family permease